MNRQEKGYQELHFDLFPGVFLDFFFCDGSYIFKHTPFIRDFTEILLINHCYRGGFQAQMQNGKYLYRGEGETTLSCPASLMAHSRLPQEVYEAVSLCVITKRLPLWLCEMLDYIDIDICEIIHRYDLKTSWFCVPENEQIRELTQRLYRQMEAGDINSLRITALSLLSSVAKLEQQKESPPLSMPPKTSRLVHKICQKMENHDLLTVPLTELVKEEKISYTVFQKVFRELYHMPPSQYRKKHWLNHGAYLLKSTRLTVTEVAALCGYDNASKFSSAFKSLMGKSPLTFRRQEATTGTE